MKSKTGIGYGQLTDKIYLGKQNQEKGFWVGEKEDITSDFLFVLDQYLPKATMRSVYGGETKSLFIHIDETEEGIEKVIKNLQARLLAVIGKEGGTHGS